MRLTRRTTEQQVWDYLREANDKIEHNTRNVEQGRYERDNALAWLANNTATTIESLATKSGWSRAHIYSAKRFASGLDWLGPRRGFGRRVD